MTTHVLYHANCPDGFGAAFAAWLALGDTDTRYRPVAYNRGLPDDIADGDRVFIVDFSYDRQTLLDLHARCPDLTVIDHHKTAAEALHGLPFVTFDMQRSGATLTWQHFFPNQPMPEMLLYVEDRDLWTWALPDSHEINLALWKGTHRSFTKWRELHEEWNLYGKRQLLEAGHSLAFADQQTIELLCKRPATLRIGAWSVPVINSPVLQSEIGHHLLQQCPAAPFSAVWCDNERGERVFSLRSRKDDFDVSTVAKAFGGGGHAAAAGFTVKAPDLILSIP